MRVLIKNPCPADEQEQRFWGDLYFGRALGDAFESEGFSVAQQFWEEWNDAHSADLLVLLRGIRPVEALKGAFKQRAIWIISHPEAVEDSELAHFDRVFCASHAHAEHLKQRGFHAEALLQCTDERVFFPRQRSLSTMSNQFVFVGNTRGKYRMIVEKSMDNPLPLRVWGLGWKNENAELSVVGPYMPNNSLGDLYGNSMCILNDHHKDMTKFGYVNNRVFDALACGAPVITEPHPGLDHLGFKGIKIIADSDDFNSEIDEFLINYERYQAGALLDAALISERHTFKHRARKMIASLNLTR